MLKRVKIGWVVVVQEALLIKKYILFYQIAGSILSAIGGPLIGLFMFGAFCPWGNAKVCITKTIYKDQTLLFNITTITITIWEPFGIYKPIIIMGDYNG